MAYAETFGRINCSSIGRIRGEKMTVCYNKLWKLLIDKNMKKKDLRLATGMSTTALAKLGKNQHVSTEILTKICKALDCDFCDIIELVQEDDKH